MKYNCRVFVDDFSMYRWLKNGSPDIENRFIKLCLADFLTVSAFIAKRRCLLLIDWAGINFCFTSSNGF